MNGSPRIESLAAHHDRSSFFSGVEALDRYFHRQAGQDQQKRVAATFVLSQGAQVLGFYTLSATSVQLAELPESIAKKLPKYPTVPATLLGRLAVSDTHRGRGYGAFLLLDALRRSLEHSREVASFAVVVDAKDDRARSFYHVHGFLPLPATQRRLFLPMATIATLF